MSKQSQSTTYAKLPAVRRGVARAVAVAQLLAVLQGCNGDALQAPVQDPPVTAAAPRLLRLVGDTVQFGGTLVLAGDGLTGDPSGFQAQLGETRLTVDSVASGRIWLRMPMDQAPCQSATAPLEVHGGGWTYRGPVVVASTLRPTLAPGGTLSLPVEASGLCVELDGPTGHDGRYVVSIMNPTPSADHVAQYAVQGVGAGALASRAGVMHADASLSRTPLPVMVSASAAHLLPRDGHPDATMAAEVSARHGQWLRQQGMYVTAATNPTATSSRTAPWPRAASARAAQVGDVVERRVATAACAAATVVRARVVYAGATVVMYEDLAAPQAARMDPWFAQLGDEYERVMLPLVRRHLGDPLARNAVLDGDGRVSLVFTPVVNTAMPGTAAFVNACNLYPRAQIEGSSADEVVYVRVPGAGESAVDWQRALRSTLVHETKHLASFAERLSRGRDFEDAWLEEATARVAEELYSRTFEGGGQWLGATTFASSVACELTGCDERPLMMYKHFSVLHQYLRNGSALSPLGPATPNDATPYASGWSLVRSVLDATGTDETAVLRSLVRGDAGRGVAALAQVAAVPAETLLERWTSMLVNTDIAAGIGAGRRSWDERSIWRGLATMFPGVFRSAPLRATEVEAGNWQLTGSVRGFSAGHLALDGVADGSQRVVIRATGGVPLRVRITRVP